MGVIEASDRAWKAVQMKGEKQGVSAWLRGIIGECGVSGTRSCAAIAEAFGIDCKHERTCRDCITKMMAAIADRIDAERALPADVEWPRFEDGGLVRIGDELEFEGKTMLVCDATFYADGWALWCDREDMSGRLYGSFDERVERPAPEVLDADGVPIKVDDVVYYDGEPHPLTVVGITRDGKDALVDANGEESCVEGGRPQDFSHDAPKPVLDADGVPIKVGDVVYFVGGSGVRYAVKDIGFEPDGAFVDIIDEEGRYSTMVNPEKLTHERPDSWRLWGEDLDMAVKVGEVDKVEMMRRAKALAKAGEGL